VTVPSSDAGFETLAEGFAFLETPRWRNGCLWAVDMFGGQVAAFSPNGSLIRRLDVDGTPTGVAWDPHGRLVVLTVDGALFTERGGRLIALPGRVDPGPARCNELTIDPHGRMLAGIFALRSGGLARVDPFGTQQLVADELLLPNGQTLTRDGRTLIVAESAGQRLTAFDITAAGTLADRRVWASFGAPATSSNVVEAIDEVERWPDGIALDDHGGIWVADPFGCEVVRVLEGGEITHRLSTGELAPYACAVGGEDGHTLFVCAAPARLSDAERRAQRSSCLIAARIEP